jgi:hypothetical protein
VGAAKDVRGKELRLERFAGSKVCKLKGWEGDEAVETSRGREESRRGVGAVYTGENSISVYCLSITLWASFERKRKVLTGLQVKKVNAGICGEEA